MTRALLSSGKNLSQDTINEFIHGENPTYHKAGPICFQGKAGWDTRLANYAGSLEQLNHAFNVVEPSMLERRRLMSVVQCPTCHYQSSTQHYKFQYEDLDANIRCRECSKLSAIKTWKCNCGSLWHTCKVHYCTQKVKPEKDKPQSDSRNMGSGKAITKRLLANATYEQLLDDDLRVQAKRDKKNWERDDKQDSHNDPAKKSDIRLTLFMLSPHLKVKFAALQIS